MHRDLHPRAARISPGKKEDEKPAIKTKKKNSRNGIQARAET